MSITKEEFAMHKKGIVANEKILEELERLKNFTKSEEVLNILQRDIWNTEKFYEFHNKEIEKYQEVETQ